jgi:RNA-directed DNA polymerase
MLNVRSVQCLATIMGVTAEILRRGTSGAEIDHREMLLIDPRKPERARIVLDVFGLRRNLLDRLYSRLLLKRLTPTIHSHGSVRGRSIVSNATAHKESIHVYKADISDFFPTIHRTKVYEIFVRKFGCSPDVASICTRLCTHHHHLALKQARFWP